MSRPAFTLIETLQVATVEVIRRLWDSGQYRQNKWLKQIHDNWFELWVDYRLAMTMSEVDAQVRGLHEYWDEAEEDPWLITEEIEGETPLGGELRATHRAFDTTD